MKKSFLAALVLVAFMGLNTEGAVGAEYTSITLPGGSPWSTPWCCLMAIPRIAIGPPC